MSPAEPHLLQIFLWIVFIGLCGVHGFALLATSLGTFKRQILARLLGAGVFVAGAALAGRHRLTVVDFHNLTWFESGYALQLTPVELVLLVVALAVMWWRRVPALWLSLVPIVALGGRMVAGEASFSDVLVLWLAVLASLGVGFGMTVTIYGLGQALARVRMIHRQSVLAWQGAPLGTIPKAENPLVTFAMMTLQNGGPKANVRQGLRAQTQYSGEFWDVPASAYLKVFSLCIGLLVIMSYGYMAFPIMDYPITETFGSSGLVVTAMLFCGAGLFLWRGGLETPLSRICHFTHSTYLAMHGGILGALAIAIAYDLSMAFPALYIGAFLAAGYLSGYYAGYRVQRFLSYAMLVPWILLVGLLLLNVVT